MEEDFKPMKCAGLENHNKYIISDKR